MANIAVIVGGGKGKRMGKGINKIFLSLAGKPIICKTIEQFEKINDIDSIILVTNKDDIEQLKKIIEKNNYKKIKKIIEGGEKRQDSVYNGIKAIENASEDDIILIHNAVNPFVSEETIKKIVEETKKTGAAVAAVKAKDTIKEVDKDNFVAKTLDRKKLWQMQTPQAIKYGLAKRAFELAEKEGFYATDDVALVERLGEKVKVIETNGDNIKITTPEDLELAKRISSDARLGLGQDSHRFEKGKKLMLGGIEIPNEDGLKGKSDGDVILHALFNALSQAIGLRSIGYYADKMCLEQGITDSKEYVKFILEKIKDYNINNIGVMVEAKRPELEPFHNQIKESISKILEIKKEEIGLTFTSGEELTDFGKGLGIQCFCIAVLSRK